MRGVVLWFEPSVEEQVLALWAQLADLGVRASQPPARPHVSLLVADGLDADLAVAALTGVALGLRLEMGAVALFPPAILHLPVTPTRELVALQMLVQSRLGIAVRGLDRYFLPGRWQPHCTLAAELPDALLAEAVRVARDALPIVGTTEWLGIEEAGSHRRWAVPPATSDPS